MIKVRRNTFETNSSSTHSITMCSGELFDKWKKGEDIYFDRWSGELITKEQLLKDYDESLKDDPNQTLEEYCESEGIYTYEDYYDNIDYETYEEEFITEKGDRVVAFGYYGMDC